MEYEEFEQKRGAFISEDESQTAYEDVTEVTIEYQNGYEVWHCLEGGSEWIVEFDLY